MFPVSDRYFVLLTRSTESEDGSLYTDASASVEYPFNPGKGPVKGDIAISGFIA